MSKNIYQRINDCMKEVKYIQKDATVQGYKAVTHDNVVAQVRDSLVKSGVLVIPTQVESKLHDKGMKWDKDAGKEVIDNMRMYEGYYQIRFQSIEDKNDFHDICIHSNALDNGDKAPGKALSYATKYAILKMFMIETGENDESRTGEGSYYTDAQKDQFDEIMEDDSPLAGFKMLVMQSVVGPDVFTALYNSFEKGKISAGKKKCSKLVAEGAETAKEYANEIQTHIRTEDPAVAEIIDELSTDEKRLIIPHLEQSDIEYLRNIKE